MDYDIIIIGSGPGGYVAAIRASQLGMKVGVVESAEPGGICLNWGCIPTKALLKSARVFEYLKHAQEYGISISGEIKPDLAAMVIRSRDVAANMSKGIQFLFKKNKIDLIKGWGKVVSGSRVEVRSDDGLTRQYEAKHIIIATGARSKEMPGLKQDGKRIIGYRQAMVLQNQPESMVVVGSGAIGSEFAYFYNAIGTKVTLIEYLPNIVPLEDEDVSKQLERSFKKGGMKIFTGSYVEEADATGEKCRLKVRTPKGYETIDADIVLSAVGITANIEGIGLEETGIITENGKIVVDEFYRTNVDGIYAIGDVVPGQSLAHVASAEGIICVEKINGLNPEPLNYGNIPGCTYCYPEIASVGYTEKGAQQAGFEIKIGKFPFTASGKANATGTKDGFVKVVLDAKYGELLGVHMIGNNVTEMIAEAVIARKLETTAHEIITAVHPHPTMSEAIVEATAAAIGEAIHL